MGPARLFERSSIDVLPGLPSTKRIDRPFRKVVAPSDFLYPHTFCSHLADDSHVIVRQFRLGVGLPHLQQTMPDGMLAVLLGGHDFEIVHAVVGLVAVLVVHLFIRWYHPDKRRSDDAMNQRMRGLAAAVE